MNSAKALLTVKKDVESKAHTFFQGSQINITSEGRPYLGCPFGSQAYIDAFVHSKVDSWKSILLSVTEVAFSSPHAAYAAFTHRITSSWLFLCCATPNISHLLDPLEQLIKTRLIPTLTGHAPPGDLERRLFALPVRLGGLNLVVPTSLNREYDDSIRLTSPLCSLISDQSSVSSYDVLVSQESLRSMHHSAGK